MISSFNPLSHEHHGIKDFRKLNRKEKAITCLVSGLVGVITFIPTFGLGGMATFRYLSHKYAQEREAKVNQISKTILKTPLEIKDVTHREALDLVENDDEPALVDIMDSLAAIKNGTFVIPDKHPLVDPTTDNPSKLKNGETMKDHGELMCGTKSVSYASVRRAVEDKTTEDQLHYETQTFTLQNQSLETIFVLSNDGNKKNFMSLFYSERAPKIFKEKLQTTINEQNRSSIEQQDMLQALNETDDEIFNLWVEHLKSHPDEAGCATTVNMLFFYPDQGQIKGGFFGMGDTRSIILRGENDVIRLGSLSGKSLGVFDIQEGDKIFISSDGIWHNASPNQVNQFIQERLKNYEDEEDKAKQMENVLVDLVKATLPGRVDDRNPMLLAF